MTIKFSGGGWPGIRVENAATMHCDAMVKVAEMPVGQRRTAAGWTCLPKSVARSKKELIRPGNALGEEIGKSV